MFSKSLEKPSYNRFTDTAVGYKRKSDSIDKNLNIGAGIKEGKFVCRIATNGLSDFGPHLSNFLVSAQLEGYDIYNPNFKPFVAIVCVTGDHPPLPQERQPGTPEYNNFIQTLIDTNGVFFKLDYQGQFAEPNYGDIVYVRYQDPINREGVPEFLHPRDQGMVPTTSPGSGGGSGIGGGPGTSSRGSSPRRSSSIPKGYFDKCKKKNKLKKTAKKKAETDTPQASNKSLLESLAEGAKDIVNDVKSYANETFGADFDIDVACKPYSKALGLSGIDVSLRYEHIPTARSPKKRKNPPISIVIHDTAGRSSSAIPCFKTLVNKGLSSHYIINDAGKIYETADPGLDRCAHASGGWNPFSIGIDMTCPVIVNADLKKSKRWDSGKNPFGERLIAAPYYKADTSKQIVDYTDAQKKALARLIKALCNKYNIPKTGIGERHNRAKFRPGGLSPSSFRGVVGHSQFSTNRVDGYNAVLILGDMGVINLK